MSHPYDASTKYLLTVRLADWLSLSGRTTTSRVEVIDAELATVTAAADRVLLVHDEPPWVFHVEPQASHDPRGLGVRMHLYNTLLGYKHHCPVRTMVVLLRKSADAPDVTGTFERGFVGEEPYVTFRYQVVRLWQMPVDDFLNGGLGIVPLAPLSAVTVDELSATIRRMDERISQEANRNDAGTLWTASKVLMGLRYPATFIAELLEGVQGMEESVTYQEIIEKGVQRGKLEEARRVLMRLGQKRFGVPPPQILASIDNLADLARLEALHERSLEAASWDELLATP